MMFFKLSREDASRIETALELRQADLERASSQGDKYSGLALLSAVALQGIRMRLGCAAKGIRRRTLHWKVGGGPACGSSAIRDPFDPRLAYGPTVPAALTCSNCLKVWNRADREAKARVLPGQLPLV